MLSASVWRGKPVLRYFGAGLLVGAELVAFVASVLGAILQQGVPAAPLSLVFAALALAVLLREAGLVRFPVPQNPRLVPERVAGLGEVGALQFGFEMGTGMRTYSPSALPHLALAAVLLVVPFAGGCALAAGFALGRFAMPLLSNAYGDDGSWTRRWHSVERTVRPVLALTTVGLLSLVALG